MRTKPRASWALYSAVLLAAAAGVSCDQSSPAPVLRDQAPRSSDPAMLGPGCDEMPDPHCSNPVNHVVIQMLRGAQIPIRDENSADLCRRMALDLMGRIPNADEMTFCDTATADQMATRFMAMPEYIMQQGRALGDHFYNLDEQWFNYVVEIDDMVNLLLRDQIRYETFITRLIVHPGFYARYQGDDWASNVVRFALGRPARADEVEGMRPLQRAWDSRYYCDGTSWYNALTDNGGLINGADGACGRTEWAMNYCPCSDGHGGSLCQTTVFGQNVDFGANGCANPDDWGDEHNLLRVTAAAAGRSAVCPGPGTFPGCGDRRFGDMGPLGMLHRLGSIDGAQLDRLYGLGRALAARPDFWEAAADHEMRHFISWWQNGLRRPDYDIPTIRPILAEIIHRTGSLRQLQYAIVTSLLYTQPAELPAGTPQPDPTAPLPPVWSFGPTRVLTAERWLDSATQVTFGQQVGICDYRFVAANDDWSQQTDRRLIMPVPAPPLQDDTYLHHYHDWVEALGGCSAALSRTTTSSLSVISAQNFIAQKLCANGTTVLPMNYSEGDNSSGNIDTGVRYLYRRAIGRDPAQDELDTARTEILACINSGAMDGCANAGIGVRWFCQRLLDSAEFAIF